MTNKYDREGGTAFPFAASESTVQGDPGMTLRDYFAAQALVGLLNDPGITEQSIKEIPSASYLLADAMLAERDKDAKEGGVNG